VAQREGAQREKEGAIRLRAPRAREDKRKRLPGAAGRGAPVMVPKLKVSFLPRDAA
jgi:hypothetical protein